jgi:hypothetical protein
MSEIEKFKKKKKALAELDIVWNRCSPEWEIGEQNEEKIKTEFLSLWKDYKNNKVTKQEFLQISNKFAEILSANKEMHNRFREILRPAYAKYGKICKALYNLEEKS